MVNIKYIIISVLALIIAIAAGIYLFPGDETRIKKQFTSLSKWVSKDPNEKKLAMATKMQNIKSVFAKTCKFEATAAGFSGTYPPDEIATRAIAGRSKFSTFALKFYDLVVNFPEEGTAKVATTARLTGKDTNGDPVDETHELECVLQKIDKTWLISEVEIVEVLKK